MRMAGRKVMAGVEREWVREEVDADTQAQHSSRLLRNCVLHFGASDYSYS